MASEGLGLLSHIDEEALDLAVVWEEHTVQQQEHVPSRWGIARRAVPGVVLTLGVLAVVAWWDVSAAPGAPTRTQAVTGVEMKVEVQEPGAVHPEMAHENDKARTKLVIETNLEGVLANEMMHGDRFAIPMDTTSGECSEHAEHLFSRVVRKSGLVHELTTEEFEAFQQRYISALRNCKGAQGLEKWLEKAGSELERQKPLMTQALVDSLNAAGLGFKAKMHEWLLHTSVANVDRHLGLKPTPEGQQSVFGGGRGLSPGDSQLPDNFQAEDKWPQCSEAILRIHNQGHCGSCWAFGGMASIDSRVCIASNGSFDTSVDVLSRLQATSCASELAEGEGADGCQGGWPHWPMQMMEKFGMVSSSCLPYYISGEGVEHFEHQEKSPPCGMETHCQGGYNSSMDKDFFFAPGVGSYTWLTQIHGDAAKVLTMKNAIYEEGPIAFAFYANRPFMGYYTGVFSVCTANSRANHAVYTSGWGELDGVPYFQASNSWGTNWGVGGRFLIHPRCMTDATFPGKIHDAKLHKVGNVDLSVPRDPTNPQWPWRATAKCPVQDGCMTDMEGDGSYADNEECVSDAFAGKTIEVVEFNTEVNYDILTINGQHFSGTKETVSSVLDGLEVDDNGIKFTSDGSVTKSGFKICAK